ncbi:MAG: 16S rRNA (adenine(1518)-N(6)/adenine(1519)-N(6))-dimethyltransferase RsmA [Acidimicrobiaceae bacterium]|nr:16S rRNA (adenine(1518)-N(6)/adenine(1519)-N(6))-dimethyltransferase RsmA [Acidimicrobiaceae bacterium]
MGLGRSEVIRLLDSFELSPSRALGQNFLCDPNVAVKIARLAEISETDRVLEIGPGIGSLTLVLASLASSVVAIEFDRYLITVLNEVLIQNNLSNVEVICADALTVDYARVLDRAFEWKLVANLPYNIATQLVLSILENQPMITEMLVMLQREVGERMCESPGTSSFSQVALKLGYFARAKVVSIISREVFIPRPNVDSVLLQIKRRPASELELDEESYDTVFSLSKLAFANRRQMIRRTLSSRMSSQDIEAAGIDPSRRPETLSLKEWSSLAETISRAKG